jgi:uncharacterized RDD family membrane protein YckC
MRCPKCHYISFGSAERCRNCGYEFLLSSETPALDLPIQGDPVDEETLNALADFSLTERSVAPPAAVTPDPVADPPRAARPTTASRFDMPLFGEDAPLVTPSAVPRAPLSVRRGQPAVARSRPDRPLPIDDAEPPPAGRAPNVHRDGHRGDQADAQGAGGMLRAATGPASVAARILAGTIDLIVLGAIDGVVLYSTLRLLGLPWREILSLPPVPLGVFLLLLNGGYLTIFTTAGGQTIGKMLAGIRVVADQPGRGPGAEGFETGVTMGASVLRASAYLASLLPIGLGFAAILFDSDGRALHDRLAETRVVKA